VAVDCPIATPSQARSRRQRHLSIEAFQVWKLDVFKNRQALLLTCYNDNASKLPVKRIARG
jgi:hypothetical protein